MAIVETVKTAIQSELDNLAKQIESEMKGMIPVRTGNTVKSIHIEHIDEYSRFVGSSYEGLYYYDQGNSATSKFVAFKPYGGIDKSKRPYANDGYVYSHGRKGYVGKDVIRKVADMHR